MLSTCLCICEFRYQLLNAWTNIYQTLYVHHGTRTYLNGVLHKSLPSISVSVCVFLLLQLGKGSVTCIPLFVARQQLSKHVPLAKNTWNSRRIVGPVIFCVVCVLSKESLWVWCIPLSLLSNGSVNTFQQQRRIVGTIVFYAVHVVLKECRWLVIPRTSCSFPSLSHQVFLLYIS